MATTTTNFGWDIPQSTDLVKDGATAIAALGQDIDTALVDLKGGTTGQVLAKASGTDLDFSWVAQDDSNAIQNAIVDAKGDLISATAADTPARLAVGANGTVLTADSSAATGLKWATPATTSSGLTLITTQSFSAVTGQSVNNCFSSTYDNYLLQINIDSASADDNLFVKMRASGADSNANYNYVRIAAFSSTIFAATSTNQTGGMAVGMSAVSGGGATNMYVFNPNKTLPTYFDSQGTRKNGTSIELDGYRGAHSDSSAYTGFSILAGSGNITGKVKVYGYANS